MNGQNKRIFNYRPMCLLAMALVSGILLGECMFLKNALFRFIPLALLLAAFVVFVCLKKTRRYAFAVVGVIVGFLGICGTNDIFAKNTAIGEYEGEIYGRISSEIRVEDDGTFRFFIEDVYAGDEALEYEAYVVLYAEEIDDCNAGDIIKITGKLVANKHTQFDSFHAYDVAKREGYMVYSGNAEKVAEGELHFWERIPYKIKYNFYKSGMGDKNAAICTALVLGDKEGLDEELYDDISTSGLAHVLAVSGLHITILSTALFFVLRKCKINAKVSLILVFLFTLFYCFICGFTASSLRALIMMTVLNFASAFGKKKDSLSSISFAAVLILIFRPTALFEAGFLMSFSAVIGIVLYYQTFNDAGMKVVDKLSPQRHIGTKISNAVSLSLSANLVSYPFVAYFFKEVPVLFVLSNIIVLPYLMFIYVFLLINTVFSLIVVWNGNMFIFKYLLYPFRAYVAVIGNLSFASVPVAISVVGIVVFLFVCVLWSRFVFLPRMQKAVISLFAIAIDLVLLAIVSFAQAINSPPSFEDVVANAKAILSTTFGRFFQRQFK